MQNGQIIVFAAPSGGGKSTIIKSILEKFDRMRFSISSTTRSMRQNEVDGKDYDFIDHETFNRLIEEGDFIEYEDVHGQLYGTRRSRVDQLLIDGYHIIFDLDVLGALSIKRVYPEALLLYIDVPSVDELRKRLILRGREDKAEIEKRLERYVFERSKAKLFDQVILNDKLEKAVSEVIEAIKNHELNLSRSA